MPRKIAAGIGVFILLLVVALGAVFASANAQAGARSASYDFHVAVLADATDKGVFPDSLHDVLATYFIENMIAPETGETPEQIRKRLSAQIARAEVTMTVTGKDGNEITSMDEWSGYVRASHWKPGRSAYSLADFIMNRGGAEVLAGRVSSALSRAVTLERATPEYAARFDNLGTPSYLDLGVFGSVGSESSLFVGLEGKVDESFGSETVCERYQSAVDYLAQNPRSKAAERVRGLLSDYFGETAEPCDSRFADVGYQLLTAAAGTAAAERDVLVFYVMVFRTDLYDEDKGRENRADYERFIEAAGGVELARGEGGFDAHEVSVAGKRLVCVYDYYGVQD